MIHTITTLLTSLLLASLSQLHVAGPATASAQAIRVLVWEEQQPQQSEQSRIFTAGMRVVAAGSYRVI